MRVDKYDYEVWKFTNPIKVIWCVIV